MVALTIISGVAFGGETGFLVGAMTMLASNFLFSQGPWTPFQMFAAGIIGFLAGVLFRKGWLRRSRAALCIYGAIAAIVLYGGLMNPVAALLSSRELSWQVLMSYYSLASPWTASTPPPPCFSCGCWQSRCWRSWTASKRNTALWNKQAMPNEPVKNAPESESGRPNSAEAYKPSGMRRCDMNGNNKHNKQIFIVISQTGTVLSRILKRITGAEYNHASLSLSQDLTRM